ncbi:MAG: hypothetical protein H6Q69_3568 [Firmicutes bacterium]|nr:hypothetical protein [Bacillota bacterium]
MDEKSEKIAAILLRKAFFYLRGAKEQSTFCFVRLKQKV